MKYPEFKTMSKTVRDDLLSRFKPEYCPNCGRASVKVVTAQSSIPYWIVNCSLCGAEYRLQMFDKQVI